MNRNQTPKFSETCAECAVQRIERGAEARTSRMRGDARKSFYRLQMRKVIAGHKALLLCDNFTGADATG